MRQFGLIGYPLSHSFSEGYFKEKFLQEHILDAQYANYPIVSMKEFGPLWEVHLSLQGLNVTIPYKKEVIQFLDEMAPEVASMQACNCIKKVENKLVGFNTDVFGFEKSLIPFLKPHHQNALILGSGGSAAAVKWVLNKLGIQFITVSRNECDHSITYSDLNQTIMETNTLIINTSPVGMYPLIENCPDIPYEFLTKDHHLFDLIYNPNQTLFLKKGLVQGATIQNGLEMLHLQAEESWRIWNV